MDIIIVSYTIDTYTENYIRYLTTVMSPDIVADFVPPIEAFKEALRYIHEEQPNINPIRKDKIYLFINERLFTGELKVNIFRKIMENENTRLVANTAILAEILYSIVNEHLNRFTNRILTTESGGKRKTRKYKAKKRKPKKSKSKKKK